MKFRFLLLTGILGLSVGTTSLYNHVDEPDRGRVVSRITFMPDEITAESSPNNNMVREYFQTYSQAESGGMQIANGVNIVRVDNRLYVSCDYKIVVFDLHGNFIREEKKN